MYDYAAERQRIEQMSIDASDVDTSVFDELLDREISDDTKTLIEAQREIYQSQYAIVDMVEFRGQQTYMAIFSTQNQLDQIYQSINENQIKIQESLEDLSDHVAAIDTNLEERGDPSETIQTIEDRLEQSADQFEDFRLVLDESMARLNGSNEELAFYMENVSENTYVPEDRQEIEYYAVLAILFLIVFALPVYVAARSIWWFVNNLFRTVI